MNSLGFGDFIFRDRDGRLIAVASTMKELSVLIKNVPDESLKYHASKDHFSTWFMARGEIQAAKKLRKFKVNDFNSLEDVRILLSEVLKKALCHQAAL